MAEKITLEHLRIVLDFVSQHNSITNKECRIATGVGYDSSIKIFNALCAGGMLKKSGEKSGTKYFAPPVENISTDNITLEHLSAVLNYVAKQGSVTTLECQEITGVTYNGSIQIPKILRTLGMLRKSGIASDYLSRYVPSITT